MQQLSPLPKLSTTTTCQATELCRLSLFRSVHRGISRLASQPARLASREGHVAAHLLAAGKPLSSGSVKCWDVGRQVQFVDGLCMWTSGTTE